MGKISNRTKPEQEQQNKNKTKITSKQTNKKQTNKKHQLCSICLSKKHQVILITRSLTKPRVQTSSWHLRQFPFGASCFTLVAPDSGILIYSFFM